MVFLEIPNVAVRDGFRRVSHNFVLNNGLLTFYITLCIGIAIQLYA